MYDKWRLTFASGNQYESDTATGALRKLSKHQWTEHERGHIKDTLTWRAFFLDGVILDSESDDEQFLRDLASTTVCQVSVFDSAKGWLEW